MQIIPIATFKLFYVNCQIFLITDIQAHTFKVYSCVSSTASLWDLPPRPTRVCPSSKSLKLNPEHYHSNITSLLWPPHHPPVSVQEKHKWPQAFTKGHTIALMSKGLFSKNASNNAEVCYCYCYSYLLWIINVGLTQQGLLKWTYPFLWRQVKKTKMKNSFALLREVWRASRWMLGIFWYLFEAGPLKIMSFTQH